MIEFDGPVCRDLGAALRREWLETNGIGGFASSTIAGANTRRYHGLLIAALHPPVGRNLLLSKLEETVFLNGERFELSVNQYQGAVHPNGNQYLIGFRLDPFPVFTYEVGGVRIEKRVFMVQGENTVVVEYEMLGAASCTLELRPLIAFRDYHSNTHANDSISHELFSSDGEVAIEPYQGMPRLHFAHNAHWVGQEGHWYYNFDYEKERERGLESLEDLFQPLVMQFTLSEHGAKATVIASTQSHQVSHAETLVRNERLRRKAERAASPVDDPLVADLTSAAGQFIVRRDGDLHTVIAGYHWFSDWGRDTMIALPGLTLVTGRFDIARDILLAFSRAADLGMLPNRFPDVGESPEYNTVDASLWFFEAIRKYLEYTSDYRFVRDDLYATMKSILDWHIAGTRYGIHCDTDGLISAGDPGTQLTWMDARIGDYVATPRHGKPVEIQALWYNALKFTGTLASRFGDRTEAQRLDEIAVKAHISFNKLFWNEATGCFYDVVDGDRRDPAIRPNQAIALSLGFTMVEPERGRQALAVIERELLTPVGLRTLSRSDPQYRRQCNGGPFDRDSAYHQGTVWPWLMGPFITGWVRVQETSGQPAAREQAHKWLRGYADHLLDAGIGSISEIFDGEPPFEPRGCIAQAWSVSEVLRVLVEDIYGKTPEAGA
jgi:predicted glycogen debranching enzyme